MSGRWAVALGRRRPHSAAARCRTSPESTEIDAPGANPTGGWVREVQREMRDPPVQFMQGFGVRVGLRDLGGGVARRGIIG